jgi:hypothetical protein
MQQLSHHPKFNLRGKESAMYNRRLQPFGVITLPILAAVVMALAWLGVANAGLLMPFIKGGSAATPEAPPPWSDPDTHIELIAPVAEVGYHSPLDVTGFSQTFEGNVSIRLLDKEGAVLAERSAIGGSVDGFDFFHTYVRFTVTEVQTGTLEVFEESAEDGSRLTEVLVPLTLLPGQRVIDLNTPAVGASLCNPFVINGYSNTFEATLSVDLRQRSGELVTQTISMGGSLGIYQDFSVAISHPVTEAQAFLVSAYETSADTGEPLDLARVPISLYPAGSEQCP